LATRGRIFISYRRGDVPGDARSVCERLERKFGKPNVFMDVDRLLAGQRFDRELDKALSQCDVLIAIIGPRWLELLAKHALGGERDFVHDEIVAALKRDIIIIPVLIGREDEMPPLPQKEDLPEDIRDLVQYQKHTIVHESFGRDADHLIAAVRSVLGAGRRIVTWRPIAALGVSLLAVVLLAYWMGMLPQLGRDPSAPQQQRTAADNAAQAGKSKSDADRAAAVEASRKKAADEESAGVAEQARRQAEADAARKKVEQETANKKAAADCDRFAASPTDNTRPSGVAGIAMGDINSAAATTPCDTAMLGYPEVARFTFQAGRAADARKDLPRAVVLYGIAAEKGSAAAMINLGDMYTVGRGANRDYSKARKWYEKATALGASGGMTGLGELYYYGNGVGQDYAEARKWYEKAAELGDARSMLASALSTIGDTA
jgi:TPR repeat protein